MAQTSIACVVNRLTSLGPNLHNVNIVTPADVVLDANDYQGFRADALAERVLLGPSVALRPGHGGRWNKRATPAGAAMCQCAYSAARLRRLKSGGAVFVDAFGITGAVGRGQ